MPDRLRRRFLDCAEKRIATLKSRILRCADSGASFEGWLNWEMAMAFQDAYPWPKYSVFREYRVRDRGLADIALFYGEEDWEAPLQNGVRIESKLIWNNSNRRKQARAVVADYEDIRRSGGLGALIIVAVSAGKKVGAVQLGSPDIIFDKTVGSFLPATIAAQDPIILLDAAAPVRSKSWWMSPKVLIGAYLVD